MVPNLFGLWPLTKKLFLIYLIFNYIGLNGCFYIEQVISLLKSIIANKTYVPLLIQYAKSDTKVVSVKTSDKYNQEGGDVVKWRGIMMGFVYFIVKQPPLQVKIYLTQTEMFAYKVMH